MHCNTPEFGLNNTVWSVSEYAAFNVLKIFHRPPLFCLSPPLVINVSYIYCFAGNSVTQATTQARKNMVPGNWNDSEAQRGMGTRLKDRKPGTRLNDRKQNEMEAKIDRPLYLVMDRMDLKRETHLAHLLGANLEGSLQRLSPPLSASEQTISPEWHALLKTLTLLHTSGTAHLPEFHRATSKPPQQLEPQFHGLVQSQQQGLVQPKVHLVNRKKSI